MIREYERYIFDVAEISEKENVNRNKVDVDFGLFDPPPKSALNL